MRRRRQKWWRAAAATGIVASLCACGGAATPGGSGAGEGMPPAEVSVRQLKAERIVQSESLVGRLSAIRSAEVRARVPGIVLERVYREGSDVGAGELLFRIDPAPLALVLKSREAALARARADAENATARLKRAQGLIAKSLIATQEFGDAEAASRVAAAQVLQAQADAEEARLDLSYAAVTSPIAGRAGRAQVTEGALVGEDDATWLTTVQQIDPLYVDFDISVAFWQTLRALQSGGGAPSMRLRTADGLEHPHPATLAFSDLAVDPRTGTIALRGIVPNPEGALLPGMFVDLLVDVGVEQPAYRVPQSAVMRDAEGAFVFLLGTAEKVERRAIVTDRSVGSDWVVVSGLADGEQLILSGLLNLRPGASAKAATPKG